MKKRGRFVPPSGLVSLKDTDKLGAMAEKNPIKLFTQAADDRDREKDK